MGKQGKRKEAQKKYSGFVRKSFHTKKTKNNINIGKKYKTCIFRKYVLKFRLTRSNSHNKNERSGYRKLIKSINKAGKQVVSTRQGRIFLNEAHLR